LYYTLILILRRVRKPWKFFKPFHKAHQPKKKIEVTFQICIFVKKKLWCINFSEYGWTWMFMDELNHESKHIIIIWNFTWPSCKYTYKCVLQWFHKLWCMIILWSKMRLIVTIYDSSCGNKKMKTKMHLEFFLITSSGNVKNIIVVFL
jgi:hypothetical protein